MYNPSPFLLKRVYAPRFANSRSGSSCIYVYHGVHDRALTRERCWHEKRTVNSGCSKIAQIQAFALSGVSTFGETAHVRNLAARLSESSNPLPRTHQQCSPPEYVPDGDAARALRAAMSKLAGAAASYTMYEAMKRLATLANDEYGWISKKELMAALNRELLKSEMLAWKSAPAQQAASHTAKAWTSSPPPSGTPQHTPVADPKKSFPAQEPAWQTAWAWTSSSAPAIPTHPWTDAEIKKAEKLVTGADWPLFDAATGI